MEEFYDCISGLRQFNERLIRVLSIETGIQTYLKPQRPISCHHPDIGATSGHLDLSLHAIARGATSLFAAEGSPNRFATGEKGQ